ncbi:Hypothetical protein Minf_0207 [Methylacidiphilum infernorum V4]|uniref:Uncharacterized protein n=1 Tax=Methylacidiphilum infernorum (isolate V4) TaxID=481448 RepID=B3DXN3_METI4|nr:Hypothetical protein Minf_0207 [Methylacidiphilum infernorum V4]
MAKSFGALFLVRTIKTLSIPDIERKPGWELFGAVLSRGRIITAFSRKFFCRSFNRLPFKVERLKWVLSFLTEFTLQDPFRKGGN